MALMEWLNTVASRAGAWLLAPIAFMPIWLSLIIVSVMTGVFMLISFKYTSNQPAIQSARNQIKASLLALSLFKDEIRVSLRSQGRLLVNAGRLLLYSLVPISVMLIPMTLLLGQLALWYQSRPVLPGEDVVLTATMATDCNSGELDVDLLSDPEVEVIAGPVRVESERKVYWSIAATSEGHRNLVLRCNNEEYTKQFVVSRKPAITSQKRPGSSFIDVVIHPYERPLKNGDRIESIEIDYPARESWFAGRDSWLISWFLISLLAAWLARPWLKVHI